MGRSPTKKRVSSHLTIKIVKGFNNLLHCSLLTVGDTKRGLALSNKNQKYEKVSYRRCPSYGHQHNLRRTMGEPQRRSQYPVERIARQLAVRHQVCVCRLLDH